MWDVPCPKVGQHACAVTQTLQIKGEGTFYCEKLKDYKFACMCKLEAKMTEVIFNQSGIELGMQDGGIGSETRRTSETWKRQEGG